MDDKLYERFWHVWRSGEWEPDTKAWLASVLEPGDLFVDAGAWIGPVSLWALELGAYVIAIEPDPVACVELRRVLADGEADHSAEIWPVAVVAEEGEEAWLAPSPRAGGAMGDSMSVTCAVSELPDARRVPSRTLPEILYGRVPVACKIDVEGYETRLAPVVVPWLVERNCAVQISCHGRLPDLGLEGVDAFDTVFVPDPRWGEFRLTPK